MGESLVVEGMDLGKAGLDLHPSIHPSIHPLQRQAREEREFIKCIKSKQAGSGGRCDAS